MKTDEVTEILEPLCFVCSNLLDWGYCIAFPGGIPREIMDSSFDHTKPWPKSRDYPGGDNGIQFEAQ